jgi:hypothetical protein
LSLLTVRNEAQKLALFENRLFLEAFLGNAPGMMIRQVPREGNDKKGMPRHPNMAINFLHRALPSARPVGRVTNWVCPHIPKNVFLSAGQAARPGRLTRAHSPEFMLPALS